MYYISNFDKFNRVLEPVATASFTPAFTLGAHAAVRCFRPEPPSSETKNPADNVIILLVSKLPGEVALRLMVFVFGTNGVASLDSNNSTASWVTEKGLLVVDAVFVSARVGMVKALVEADRVKPRFGDEVTKGGSS